MTTRHESPPPIRQALDRRHASRDGLSHERDAAERHAWDALGRYKVRDVRLLVRHLGPPQPSLPNPETQPLERTRGRRPAAPGKTQ